MYILKFRCKMFFDQLTWKGIRKMAVRVCPICDKKMKFAHFCTNCKTYIREPMYWNQSYNLNGEGSESTVINQCENHNHIKENATGKVRSNYNQPSHKNAMTKVLGEYKTDGRRTSGEARRQTHGKKNTFMTIILIYIALQFIIPMIAMFFSIFTRF